MGIKRRYKNFIEKFLAADHGKRFFQFFYNFGAAIVVIGALAKITHWPWGLGNILLYVGLITESLVFLIAAFDKPAKEWLWNRVFPILDSGDESDRPEFNGGNGGTVVVGGVNCASEFIDGKLAGGSSAAMSQGAIEGVAPGEIKKTFGIPNATDISEEDTNALSSSIKKMAAAAEQLGKMAEMTEATQGYLEQLTTMSEDMRKFSEVTNNLTDVSDILLNSYKSITDNSDGINMSSRGYVQQMESLNRNIQGLNTIYEIQLKSVSSQIDAIEKINSGLMRIRDLYEGSIVDSSVFRTETERMAHQLQQLNGVYSRLLNAMTVNMYTNPGFPPTGGYGSHPQSQEPQTPNV
ncbi:gliding motility protein GldL [Bacteroidales bacterium OttesenSCG-928-M06]|nr:gliding motility protein GldL [Bacteroidales bacterium OttesenSCG-928-M06]